MFDLSQIQGIIARETEGLQFPEAPIDLYDPIRYTLGLGGKRMRPALLVLSCLGSFFGIIFTNDIFNLYVFIEILSTLITLLLITSTFSTTYFYNNLNLNLHNYFNNTTPFFFVQMLMYFFWISLISSLNLFFFLILFYIKFLTFD
jgi:hypothetical protein